jgi:hypothetical protein
MESSTPAFGSMHGLAQTPGIDQPFFPRNPPIKKMIIHTTNINPMPPPP